MRYKGLLILLVFAMFPPLLETARSQAFLQWNWSQDRNGFNLRAGSSSTFTLKGVGGSVSINGETCFTENAELVSLQEKESKDGPKGVLVEYALPGVNCHWIWEIDKTDRGLEITASLKNTGSASLQIEDWDVVHLSQARGSSFRAGEKPGDVRFFRWAPWDMRVEILDSDEGQHRSDNLCLLFDPLSEQSFMAAFLTMDRMHAFHELKYSPTNGIEGYKARCSFGKFKLDPGILLASERLCLSFESDPYVALEEWADYIYEQKQPVFAELPPVGINSHVWTDTFNPGEGSCEEIILGNARAVRDRLNGFNITYQWLSQTNLKGGIPGNWMLTDDRMPGGLGEFCKELDVLGFIPGLWVAPFWFCSEAEGVLEENKENLARDCNGEPIWEFLNWGGDFGDITPWSRLHKYYLDGTHPQTEAFVKKVFSYYRDIGVGYYMLDFLGVPKEVCMYDPTLTPLQAAGNILKVIRETAGNYTHLQTAVSSTPAFSGLINAARVGRDFGEGRPLQGGVLSDWRNATYVLHDEHYANTFYLNQNAAASYFTHRKLYINDLNVLTVDKPVPLEHARIATSIFGLCGSPMILGDEYSRISEDRLRLVKLCLPRTKDMPVPVDLFENVYPDDYSRFLDLPVETGWDSYHVLAIFNHDDTAYDAELDFSRLGLDKEKTYRVYEFWTEEYWGTYRESFSYIIPPNSCRLFRISEARKHPWLLSSDMHIQQGRVEVEALIWDEERMCLSVVAKRPVGQTGNLYFLMPRKMRVVNNHDLSLMKDLNDMNVIIRKEIRFENELEAFEIFFEPWEEKYIVAKPLLPYDTEAEWLDYVKTHRKPGDTRVFE